MRLENLTDKKTPKLEQYSLLAQSIGVDDRLLKPGTSMAIKDEDQDRIEAEHAHLFDVGALGWAEEAPAAALAPPAVEATPELKNALVDMNTKEKKKD